MKRNFLFFIIVSLTVSSYAQEKKAPIEGAWKLIYSKFEGIDLTFPEHIKGSDIKMWSKEHFTFVGQFKMDTTTIDNYGWGTYKLNGNKYEEHVMLHGDKPSIGKTFRMILEIRNDTLIQQYSTDENWKLPKNYSTEKYVRIK
jgi:hypothetical protein